MVKFVIEAIQCSISAANPIEAMSNRLLHQLSLRVMHLTRLLPDTVTVYGLFVKNGGPSLHGAHYR